MSADGFNELTKALAASASRRAALKGLLKGVAVALGASAAGALGTATAAPVRCACVYDCNGNILTSCKVGRCPARGHVGGISCHLTMEQCPGCTA
jgi:hypothetical protein